MFGESDRDLATFLTAAERHAAEAARYNGADTLRRLTTTIERDRRFDAYDAAALALRVRECRRYGAELRLDDPELAKGGEPRPAPRPSYAGRI